jgi:excisionase family DNA binding protein
MTQRPTLAERVVISSQLDPFLSLRASAAYTSLSTRTLRGYFSDPAHPLPHYKVGGKYLLRRSELDAWLLTFRHEADDVEHIVDDVVRELTAGPPSA